MQDLLLRLIRSGGPITTAELVQEIRTLVRTGCVVEIEDTYPSVREGLDALAARGKVEEAPANVWHPVYRPAAHVARQAVMF